MKKTYKELFHELKHHLPFTALATILALAISLFFINFSLDINEKIFHSLHFIHIFASSIVTAGIFYKYKKKAIQAILVGITGAIIIGSLSDVIFPWLGSLIFQFSPHFHLPLIEIPLIILSIALGGSLLGVLTTLTKIPHLFHVGISVFASLFYLITYTSNLDVLFLILSFLIILISVIIPCCISDILYPFFFLGKKIKSCNCKN
ncbi:MAG: hypothetical protein ACOCUU_01110 [Nanoarchaeota archaeon]